MSFDGNGNYTVPGGTDAITGQVIDSTKYNALLRNLEAALTKALLRDGQSAAQANIPMGGFKLTGAAAAATRAEIPLMSQVQDGAFNLLTSVAGTNTITATQANPTLTAYTNGLTLRFVAANTNSGAVTLNVNSIGAVSVLMGATALESSRLQAGRAYSVMYDGASWQLLSAGYVSDVTALTSVASVNGGPLAGMRNRIHNGGFQIDQRNRYAAQTITAGAALAYTADRFYGYCTGANVTGQVVDGSEQSQKRYRFTGAASVTAIGFGTRLEARDTYDLNNKTVTIAADLANSLLTTVTWTLSRATTSDDTFGTLAAPTVTQLATGTFTVSSTVTRYSAQISLPTAATTGLQLVFSVGAQISGTWTIGDVQLELGPVATVFEKRPYALELATCQRYFETIADLMFGHTLAANEVSASFHFLVEKREVPNAFSGGAGHFLIMGSFSSGGGAIALSGITTLTALSTGKKCVLINGVFTDGTTGLTVSRPGYIRYLSTFIGLSADL